MRPRHYTYPQNCGFPTTDSLAQNQTRPGRHSGADRNRRRRARKALLVTMYNSRLVPVCEVCIPKEKEKKHAEARSTQEARK
jgi:hypothetical protein